MNPLGVDHCRRFFGDYGFSGNGAAGFELDHVEQRIGSPQNHVLLARSAGDSRTFMLVAEEQLTHLINLIGGPEEEAFRVARGRLDHLLRQPAVEWLGERRLAPVGELHAQ